MRKLIFHLLIVSMTVVSVYADKRVNLTINNSTAKTLKVSVQLKKANGLVKQDISVGNLPAGSQKVQMFKVDDNGQYVVSAYIPGSAAVFEEVRTVSSAEPNTITASVELEISQGIVLDETTSIEALRSAFSRIGPSVGFKPIQVSVALKTIFGGLFLISPPDASNDSKVYFQLTPAQFTNEVSNDAFSYQVNADRIEKTFSTGTNVAAAAAIPVISQFGFDFDKSSAYSLVTEFRDFGFVPKIEQPNVTVASALAALSPPNKSLLCREIAQHPTAKLLYVNKIYAVRNVNFILNKGEKLSTSARAEGSTVITTSGAYKFESANNRTTSFQTFVLNMEGIEFSLGGNDGEIETGISCPRAAAAQQAINKGIGGGLIGAMVSDIVNVRSPAPRLISQKTLERMLDR